MTSHPREVSIDEVFMDADAPNGRLHVRPALPRGEDYKFIYRAALSVRWHEAQRSLYVVPVKEFTTVDDFAQMFAAVRGEYGDRLAIGPRTRFTNMPAEVELSIRELNQDLLHSSEYK